MRIKIAIVIVVSCVISLGWVVYSNVYPTVPEIKLTKVEFQFLELDLGVLEQGVPKVGSFFFKNSGNYPLVIYDVQTSCGCVSVEWPKLPIKSDDSGKIKVIFDAKYSGRFSKSVMVFCNIEKVFKELHIRGEVGK
ncbi:DUF1573 domain-containing protein [Marinilabiliaceae bacterium JC017]|nr:DUF1573 domain-containing protein [Marinilabiliaceae bacterium JC017]